MQGGVSTSPSTGHVPHGGDLLGCFCGLHQRQWRVRTTLESRVDDTASQHDSAGPASWRGGEGWRGWGGHAVNKEGMDYHVMCGAVRGARSRDCFDRVCVAIRFMFFLLLPVSSLVDIL